MLAGRGQGNGSSEYDRSADREERRGSSRKGRRDRRDVERDRERERDHDDSSNSFAARYQSLEEVVGQVWSCKEACSDSHFISIGFNLNIAAQVLTIAKDQNGCRYLQRKFDEGGATAISVVFPEILEHLIELMTDPFGNYLTQKLLDRCSEEQRLQVQFSFSFQLFKIDNILQSIVASVLNISCVRHRC